MSAPAPGEAVLATGMDAACAEAEAGLAEGGIPIGAVLMRGDAIVGRGRNQRIQRNSQILHGEMACFENAGRRNDYGDLVLFTTLSPCMMCAGTIVQFGIKTVVIGENRNFGGNETFLAERGVRVIVRQDPRCIRMMADFILNHPGLWNEDIST